MLRKNIITFTIIIVLLLVLTSCGASKNKDEGYDELFEETPSNTEDGLEDSNLRKTILYYQDDAGYLVPVMRKIPWEEGIAKAALRKMMDSPEEQIDLMFMGLKALLPAETEIIGLSISQDGLAKVDFNEAVMECKDAISENNMVQGVVMTLCSFPTINRVQFLFNGKKVNALKYGTDIENPITPQDINWEMGSDANADGVKVTVFFNSTSTSQYDYLVPITRVTNESVATLETAIQELLKGPTDKENLNIDFPEGTKLIGLEMNQGITYINFSKEFRKLSESSEDEDVTLKALIMTAKQFPEIQEVKILVEGKEYKDANQIGMSVFANEY